LRVLVLEFRGRGYSDYDPIPARYTPLTYAGDVLELLNQLQIPSCTAACTLAAPSVAKCNASDRATCVLGCVDSSCFAHGRGPLIRQQGRNFE